MKGPSLEGLNENNTEELNKLDEIAGRLKDMLKEGNEKNPKVIKLLNIAKEAGLIIE